MFYDYMELDFEVPTDEQIIKEVLPDVDDFDELLAEPHKRTAKDSLLRLFEYYYAWKLRWTALRESGEDIQQEALLSIKVDAVWGEINRILDASDIKM